jgi:SAM-dependent methyltransferase
MTEKTKEIQYSYLLEKREKRDSLGIMMGAVWKRDPKRLGFVLSRYKFISKLLEGFSNVLEIGCGDGWPARVVAVSVDQLTLTDFDPLFVEESKFNTADLSNVKSFVADFCNEPIKKKFQGVYLCDVFEHIPKNKENFFIENICQSLDSNGVLIIGIPSLESQALIPENLRDVGHVNCKSGVELKKFLLNYFSVVFLFSMNDELIHTGHTAMANYLFAVCTNAKSKKAV